MKFEAIDPFNPSHVCVVTVIKVLRFNYFVLGVDSLATYFVCHANSINIFPCGWAKTHGLQLHPPRGSVLLFYNLYSLRTLRVVSLLLQNPRGRTYKLTKQFEGRVVRPPASARLVALLLARATCASKFALALFFRSSQRIFGKKRDCSQSNTLLPKRILPLQTLSI